MSPPVSVLLMECRRTLLVSQGELGQLLGMSRHTGQRWETGRSTPSSEQLHKLASLIHPRNAELAARVAAAGGTTLEALGIAKPAAPPSPTPVDVVDAVVCAGAEAIDVTPRAIRPALLAAFARARRLGLSVEDVEKALGATGAEASNPAKDAKAGAATTPPNAVAKKSR